MIPEPLAEVEQRVLARARTLALDPDADTDRAALRALIVEEVARWNATADPGQRRYPFTDTDAAIARIERDLTGLGPLEPLLADDDVWEIMINGPDQIFVRRHRGDSGYHHEVFHDDDHVLRTITRLLDRCSSSHRKLDPAEGLQDAQLDDGSRVHIVHRDIARGGHLLVNIRRFTGVAFRSLAELTARGMLTPEVAAFLRACVRARCSIVFAGPPGAGKTTLLACCAAELPAELRVVTAEEVFELDVPLANVAAMQTRPARSDRPAVDLRRLVAGFLRMAPDVAIVGEVRDREALPLLLTLSSGVTGYTTIHAGSARQALTRLRFICQLADTRSELPISALNQLVTEAVDLVVHCTRRDGVPVVEEVVAVEDHTAGADAPTFTTTSVFHRGAGGLCWTGQVPVRLTRRLADSGTDIRRLLDGAGRDARAAADSGIPTRTASGVPAGRQAAVGGQVDTDPATTTPGAERPGATLPGSDLHAGAPAGAELVPRIAPGHGLRAATSAGSELGTLPGPDGRDTGAAR